MDSGSRVMHHDVLYIDSTICLYNIYVYIHNSIIISTAVFTCRKHIFTDCIKSSYTIIMMKKKRLDRIDFEFNSQTTLILDKTINTRYSIAYYCDRRTTDKNLFLFLTSCHHFCQFVIEPLINEIQLQVLVFEF